MNELAQCLKLRPGDSEAQALDDGMEGKARSRRDQRSEFKRGAAGRIVRSIRRSRLQTGGGHDGRGECRTAGGADPATGRGRCARRRRAYLDRGLLLEAERLYQAAVAADGTSAEAHAGLAEVRERSGDADAARKEAQKSLELGPSANAYLVLAQLDLAAGNLGTANTDADDALKLEPANRAAQD
jgi:tetratricopeptide (TPR) repeat protein